VTVTGSGFANAETGITVTYDATTVYSGGSASSVGAWTATFQVPASASGTHVVRAYGSSSPTSRDIIFTSTPTVTINKTGGAPEAR